MPLYPLMLQCPKNMYILLHTQRVQLSIPGDLTLIPYFNLHPYSKFHQLIQSCHSYPFSPSSKWIHILHVSLVSFNLYQFLSFSLSLIFLKGTAHPLCLDKRMSLISNVLFMFVSPVFIIRSQLSIPGQNTIVILWYCVLLRISNPGSDDDSLPHLVMIILVTLLRCLIPPQYIYYSFPCNKQSMGRHLRPCKYPAPHQMCSHRFSIYWWFLLVPILPSK